MFRDPLTDQFKNSAYRELKHGRHSISNHIVDWVLQLGCTAPAKEKVSTAAALLSKGFVTCSSKIDRGDLAIETTILQG